MLLSVNLKEKQKRKTKTKKKNKKKMWIYILLGIVFLLAFLQLIKSKEEGFQNTESFVSLAGDEIYDSFYADVYEYLAFKSHAKLVKYRELLRKK